MVDSLSVWLVLPLGIALGWYMRGRGSESPQAADGSAATPETLAGMNHLVNDDPDQAVASLLRATELDSHAVELHLTLGVLFRKRGEVDRALRIHEALAERGQLSTDQMERTRFELGQDYLKAGMIDRAEELFEQLSHRGLYATPALEALISVHEQSREWRRAIEASRRLTAVGAQPRQLQIAQYYCELADQAKAAKDAGEAQRLAQRALEEDAGCVRANLILARLQEDAGDARAAIRSLREVPDQDIRFVPEIVEPLLRCSQTAGQIDEFLEFLRDIDDETSTSASVIAQARLMRDNGVNPQSYLAESFTASPSWTLLDQLMQAVDLPTDETMAAALTSLRDALKTASAGRARYRCTSCGLGPGLLFWQCPSCKQWGSVIPADDKLVPAKG